MAGVHTVEEAIEEYAIPTFFPYMLLDVDRNRAFRDACETMIRQFQRDHGTLPRVLDMGAGTGLLSLYCARLGCDVVAIEGNADRVKIMRDNVARHQFSGSITIVHGMSTQYGEPGQFDAVVTETLATIPHFEKMYAFLADLYERGVVVMRDKMYCVPQQLTATVGTYRMPDTTLVGDTGADLVLELTAELSGQKERGPPTFRQADECYMTVHRSVLKPSAPPVQVFSAPAWTKPEGTVFVDVRRGDWLVVEWDCILWHGDTPESIVVLHHTVQHVSSLSSLNYYSRIMQWGFRVACCNATRRWAIQVTDTDLLIKVP